MQILPIATATLRPGDDLAALLTKQVQDGDILVVSSKALSMIEGRLIDLASITPTEEAETYAETCRQDPAFTQAVLDETKRLNGEVAGTCPWALLTSVKPAGMKTGRILCPNAGLDQSNVEKGKAIGWPEDPVKSVAELRKNLGNVGIILSDSCCRPGRLGVTAFALATSGIDPLLSQVGKKDLFDRELKFTHEAVADQLAVAANAVMGNANQSVPAAIIRDHGFALSDYEGWVEGIEKDEDLFGDILK